MYSNDELTHQVIDGCWLLHEYWEYHKSYAGLMKMVIKCDSVKLSYTVPQVVTTHSQNSIAYIYAPNEGPSGQNQTHL